MHENKVKVFELVLQTYIGFCVRKLIKCALVFSLLRVLSPNMINETNIYNVHIMHIHPNKDFYDFFSAFNFSCKKLDMLGTDNIQLPDTS